MPPVAAPSLPPEPSLDDLERIMNVAVKAKEQAYCPYSKFRVGAGLLTSGGAIFSGCNVENASYGLACCAERTAIFKAVSEGHTSFQAIVVTTDIKGYVSPCGACRQVMIEFGNFHVFVLNSDDMTTRRYTTHTLLPESFGTRDLIKDFAERSPAEKQLGISRFFTPRKRPRGGAAADGGGAGEGDE